MFTLMLSLAACTRSDDPGDPARPRETSPTVPETERPCGALGGAERSNLWPGAVDLAALEHAWTAELPVSSPTHSSAWACVANGLVYTASGGAIHALALADGTPVWTHTPTLGLDTSTQDAAVATADGVVYAGAYFSEEVAWSTAAVLALDGATGEVIWRRDVTGVPPEELFDLVVDGDGLLVTFADRLIRYDRATGDERWVLEGPSLFPAFFAFREPPAVVDGVVLIPALAVAVPDPLVPTYEQFLHAIALDTGAPLWTIERPELAVTQVPSGGGGWFAYSGNGVGVRTWDAHTGDPGILEADFPAAGNVVVDAEHEVLYAFDDGALVEADLATGERRWDVPGPGWRWGAYVSADEAAIYRGGSAWSRDDGALLWGSGADDGTWMVPAGGALVGRDHDVLTVYLP